MLEPVEEQYRLIGRITKPHNVHGEVVIVPEAELAFDDLFDILELVRLRNNRGDLVPVRIKKVRPQRKSHKLSFFVKFDRIADRNEAEKWRGADVYAERALIEEQLLEEDEDEFIDYHVYDERERYIGLVYEVMDNPAHPILEVVGEGRRWMIPFVDEYISEVDDDNETIICRNLEQLEDL